MVAVRTISRVLRKLFSEHRKEPVERICGKPVDACRRPAPSTCLKLEAEGIRALGISNWNQQLERVRSRYNRRTDSM